ncbi:MAG: GNAT family N-acetyltransferase [Betaproteobacteria bacterium]
MSRGSEVHEDLGLQVSLTPCPVPQDLAPEWRALQAQAEPNFFTGWTWIGCWLQHLGPAQQPVLVRVHRGAELVGLAVMVPQRARRLRVWPSQALHLHATGQREWDDITVEHNGWLVRRGLEEQVQGAVTSQLWALAPSVDQVCMPGVAAGHERWRDAPPPVACVRETSEPAYRVDLSSVRASGRTFLDTVGAQTRATVRRSLRLYQDWGQVLISLARDVPQALQFLDRLKYFHQLGWSARGQPGAFANPLFERFHQRLIAAAWPAGQVQLLRVTAGSAEVGYLYNFVEAGQMLAYQSGFHFGLTERNHHPGLVTHALAVQQALDAGLDGYDFLAGQARYKQQLSHQTYAMATFTLHRPSLGLWLEQTWRRVRGRFTVPVVASSTSATPSSAS